MDSYIITIWWKVQIQSYPMYAVASNSDLLSSIWKNNEIVKVGWIITPRHYSIVVYSMSVYIVPLRHIVWRQTAGWRRFRQWCLSWWSADTDVSAGFHSKRWPGPTGLQPTHKRTQVKEINRRHTNEKTQYLTTVCVLTDGVLRWKVNGVCVEKLQEGSVDGVGELADLYHLLLILRPLGAKHGPEMLTPTRNKRPHLHCIYGWVWKKKCCHWFIMITFWLCLKCTWTHAPDLQHSFVNVNALAVNAEFQIRRFWIVKLFLQSLCNSHEAIMLWNNAEHNNQASSPYSSYVLKTDLH